MQYMLSLHNYPTVFCPPADSLWRQLEREKTLFAGSLCFRERARRGKKMLCVGCITTFFVSDWELLSGIDRWGEEKKSQQKYITWRSPSPVFPSLFHPVSFPITPSFQLNFPLILFSFFSPSAINQRMYFYKINIPVQKKYWPFLYLLFPCLRMKNILEWR